MSVSWLSIVKSWYSRLVTWGGQEAEIQDTTEDGKIPHIMLNPEEVSIVKFYASIKRKEKNYLFF